MVIYTHTISLSPIHQPMSLNSTIHNPKYLHLYQPYKHAGLFQLKHSGRTLFNLFLQNEKDCTVLEYPPGLVILTPHLLMYSDGQLTLKRHARDVLNIALYRDHLIVLTHHSIYKLDQHVFQRRTRGTFKFPLKVVTENITLPENIDLSEFKQKFGYFKIEQYILIHSSKDLILIDSSQIIAHRRLSETIVNLDRIKSQTILNTLSGSYIISISEREYKALKEPSSPRDYKIEMSVAKYLSGVDEPCTITDILWQESIGKRPVDDFIKTWHLEPLDRKTLKSNEFYRDTMYDLMKYRLAVSVFSLYKQTPHLLIQLREAIREQETNIYADGLISPEEPLTSLITENMPLPLPQDNQEQRNIRETFNM